MKLLETVHSYQKELDRLKSVLQISPNDWSKYQADLNLIIDSVFGLCWEYERNHADEETKVYKLKRMFMSRFMKHFRLGRLSRMVVDKPYGYHGDFLIIDEIYRNNPQTQGLERCMDEYFLKTPASTATRNRKEDFIFYLKEIIKNSNAKALRFMDLASGPCRDIKELLDSAESGCHITIDCVDHDLHAIEYGKQLLSHLRDNQEVTFIQKNAMRIALTKDIEKQFSQKYDAIFSTGLFDYLDDRIAIPLVANLKKLLNPSGVLIISNYRDKWSNPSRLYMEWGGGWELIYRTEEDFLRVFKEAGFQDHQLSLKYEKQRVMQYRFARN